MGAKGSNVAAVIDARREAPTLQQYHKVAKAILTLRVRIFATDCVNLSQPPNGIGPKCSAIGPKASLLGRKSKAPTSSTVPSSTKPNVAVSVRSVPAVNGVVFFAARLAARAMGAMIGMEIARATSPDPWQCPNGARTAQGARETSCMPEADC